MPQIIHFDPQLSAWSAAVFWIVAISVVVTLAFTVVVFACGLADLRYLLRALNEPRPDSVVEEADDVD